MSDESTDSIPATKLASGKEHARQAADDLRAAATEKLSELRETATQRSQELRAAAEARVTDLRGKAGTAWDQARTRADSLREDSEAYVRDRPLQAVLTAFGVGLFLGLLIRR
jgi:ElaB/YqjD/DUF883 family membrane-anchored ribosome-binding protein